MFTVGTKLKIMVRSGLSFLFDDRVGVRFGDVFRFGFEVLSGVRF